MGLLSAKMLASILMGEHVKEITEDDLRNLEHLCRFRFSDEERSTLLNNLKKIFKYMDMVREFEVEGVIGKHNLLECTTNCMYEDEVEESLPREKLLENAPAQVGGMVKIPPVIEF